MSQVIGQIPDLRRNQGQWQEADLAALFVHDLPHLQDHLDEAAYEKFALDSSFFMIS